MAVEANTFETTYQCLQCKETINAESDTSPSLITAEECPSCGTEAAPMKAIDQTQVRPVDMDTIPDERKEELYNYVGSTFRWEGRDRVFTVSEFRRTTKTIEGQEAVCTVAVLDYKSGSMGTISIDDFDTNLSADIFEPTHEAVVPEEEARATQYYVAEVTDDGGSENVEVGDRELILTDDQYRKGDTNVSPLSPNPKRWEIVAGPFECPPMPHVLALEQWVSDTNPDDAMEHLPGDF